VGFLTENMKIKYLTIQNFRGIKKLENLEIGNLNTFVGKNDSGKSIILKALDCFFNEKVFNEKDFFKGKKKEEKTIIQISFLLEKEVDDLLLDKNKLLTIKKEYSMDDKGKIKIEDFYLSNDFEDEKYQDLWSKKESDLNKKQEELKISAVN
jgi:predicted ATP-dependent endonuclease of OLD family